MEPVTDQQLKMVWSCVLKKDIAALSALIQKQYAAQPHRGAPQELLPAYEPPQHEPKRLDDDRTN